MHHGDVASLFGGAVLSIAANAAGWMAHQDVLGHGLLMLLYGAVGGLGGWGMKRIIEKVTARKEQANKNDNNQKG